MSARRWSLARRLKTWFALVCVLPLLIASAVGGWFLSGSVDRELETLVREELEEAEAMLGRAQNPTEAFADISATLADHHPTLVMAWRMSDSSTGKLRAVFGNRKLGERLDGITGRSEDPQELESGVLWASREFPDGLLLHLVLDGTLHTGPLGRYWVTAGLVMLLSLMLALGMAHVLATRVSRMLAQVGTDLREREEPGHDLGLAPDEIREVSEELRATLRRIREHGDQTRLFMASLAHELRSPIQNLLGRAEVTLMRPRDEVTYREALTEQLEELAEFGDAVDNFLTLCASGSPDGNEAREEFDLEREMGLRMQREQRRASRLGVRLDIDYAGETVLVGDREAVLRAVRNVIANAVNWSGEGSEVQVRLKQDGHELVLTVDDEGPGIPEEAREDVFLPFRQCPQRGGRRTGFGLGLAITKKAVEAQGGHIELSTSPLGGARFQLFFPRTRGGATPARSVAPDAAVDVAS